MNSLVNRVLNYTFTDEMVEFQKESLLEATHFRQKDKFIDIAYPSSNQIQSIGFSESTFSL